MKVSQTHNLKIKIALCFISKLAAYIVFCFHLSTHFHFLRGNPKVYLSAAPIFHGAAERYTFFLAQPHWWPVDTHKPTGNYDLLISCPVASLCHRIIRHCKTCEGWCKQFNWWEMEAGRSINSFTLSPHGWMFLRQSSSHGISKPQQSSNQSTHSKQQPDGSHIHLSCLSPHFQHPWFSGMASQ